MLDADGGHVIVSGPQIPTVRIERRGPATDQTPIGTLDPRSLGMTVEGLAATVTPSSGGILRGSHKARVESLAGHVLFAPCSGQSHRLVRGTAYSGDNEMGRFERGSDGQITVQWSDDRSLFGVLPKKSAAQPTDAAIGYALAAAFGTGGRDLFGGWDVRVR